MVAGVVIIGVLVLLLVAYVLGWVGPRRGDVTPDVVPGTGGAGAPSVPGTGTGGGGTGGAGGAGTGGGAAPKSMLPTFVNPGYVLV